MTLAIIHDVHAGVQRSAGTTALTQWKLRQLLQTKFRSLLQLAHNNDVMILGDLFDTFNVPLTDLLGVFESIDWFCSVNLRRKVLLVPGNHDLSKTSNVVGSFQLLAAMLQRVRPEQIGVMWGPGRTKYGYVIPHMPNQDLFNEALKEVEGDRLFLHCNYDNNFAEQSDQSLNLSKEQAAELRDRGVRDIIIAHEHQTKVEPGIWIPGNQIASSVSDWLGTPAKKMAMVNKDGNVVLVPVVDADREFIELDWHALRETPHLFIRVTGEAAADEAADVVSAISRFRSRSQALVITNSVKIANRDVSEEFANTLQSVKSFDVLEALREVLSPEEWAIVESVK